MQKAKELKRYTVGHIPFAVGLDNVISAGMDEIAHIEDLWYELVDFDRDIKQSRKNWLPYILKTAAEQYAADLALDSKELAQRYAGRISEIADKVKSAKIPVNTTLAVQEAGRL